MASGADWLFIPEAPPEDGWENFMCERLGEVSVKGLLTCNHLPRPWPEGPIPRPAAKQPPSLPLPAPRRAIVSLLAPTWVVGPAVWTSGRAGGWRLCWGR